MFKLDRKSFKLSLHQVKAVILEKTHLYWMKASFVKFLNADHDFGASRAQNRTFLKISKLIDTQKQNFPKMIPRYKRAFLITKLSLKFQSSFLLHGTCFIITYMLGPITCKELNF